MRLFRSCFVFAVALCWFPIVALSCAPPPPNLSPAGQQAWKQLEIIRDLDLVRDLAQDGSSTVPPAISVSTARIVTQWHKTAIQIVRDQPSGWKQTTLDGLTGLQTNIPTAEYARLQVYIAAAIAAVKEIP